MPARRTRLGKKIGFKKRKILILCLGWEMKSIASTSNLKFRKAVNEVINVSYR
jgi:hypothetical protein